MNIRFARKDEVNYLQELNDEIFVDNKNYDDDLMFGWAKSEKGRTYFSNLLNNPNSCCFVVEDNNKLVGYVAASPLVTPYRNSKYIEIENMGVTPKYRSKGIGAKLINECLKWAKDKGFDKAYLNCYFKNQKAIDFYKRQGFSEIDICLEKKI